MIGVLLSLRAGATIACRLVLTGLLRLLGRPALLTLTCFLAAALGAGVAVPVPVPVWALAVMLTALCFCLGVGQPLSMTTVVRAAPDEALHGARAAPDRQPARPGGGADGSRGTVRQAGGVAVGLLGGGAAIAGEPGGRRRTAHQGPRRSGCAARAVSDGAPGVGSSDVMPIKHSPDEQAICMKIV